MAACSPAAAAIGQLCTKGGMVSRSRRRLYLLSLSPTGIYRFLYMAPTGLMYCSQRGTTGIQFLYLRTDRVQAQIKELDPQSSRRIR